MKKRIFGNIPGYPEGTLFPSRQSLSVAGVHRPTQAGISGAAHAGSDSIVLSGGYEDDEDYGSLIIYTGDGGRNPNTSEQVSDQLLTLRNLALATVVCMDFLFVSYVVPRIVQKNPLRMATDTMDYIVLKVTGAN